MNNPPSSLLFKTYWLIAGQKATHLSFVLHIHLIQGKFFCTTQSTPFLYYKWLMSILCSFALCWSYLFVGTIMRNGLVKVKDVNPHIRTLIFQYREWNALGNSSLFIKISIKLKMSTQGLLLAQKNSMTLTPFMTDGYLTHWSGGQIMDSLFLCCKN